MSKQKENENTQAEVSDSQLDDVSAGSGDVPMDSFSINFAKIEYESVKEGGSRSQSSDDVIVDGNIITAENFDSA